MEQLHLALGELATFAARAARAGRRALGPMTRFDRVALASEGINHRGRAADRRQDVATAVLEVDGTSSVIPWRDDRKRLVHRRSHRNPRPPRPTP